MSEKVTVTLKDLNALALTAQKNGTLNEFAGVAIEWAGEAAAAVVRLRAENELLRADAERYRWLRTQSRLYKAYDIYKDGGLWAIGIHTDDSNLSFDAAIDAARKA